MHEVKSQNACEECTLLFLLLLLDMFVCLFVCLFGVFVCQVLDVGELLVGKLPDSALPRLAGASRAREAVVQEGLRLMHEPSPFQASIPIPRVRDVGAGHVAVRIPPGTAPPVAVGEHGGALPRLQRVEARQRFPAVAGNDGRVPKPGRSDAEELTR